MDNLTRGEGTTVEPSTGTLYDETILGSADVIDGQRLLLHEERLAPIKRNVQGQRAIVTRRAVSVRQTVEVDVVHEELEIRYEAGDGSEVLAAEPETIIVRLRAEEIEIVKHVRIVEEVHLTKRRVVEQQTVRGTVRREVLDVEQDASVAVAPRGQL